MGTRGRVNSGSRKDRGWNGRLAYKKSESDHNCRRCSLSPVSKNEKITPVALSNEQPCKVTKKTVQAGLINASSWRTNLSLILIASGASCIYFVYMLLFNQASRDPFHRPVMIGSRKPIELPIGSKMKNRPCDLPDLKPFDPQITKYIVHPGRVDCEKKFPRIFKSNLNGTVIQVVDPKKYGFSQCCYQSFQKMTGIDPSAKYSKPCVSITGTETLINPPIEFIRINCVKGLKQVPVDFFGFTPHKNSQKKVPSVPKKEKRKDGRAHKSIRKVNVVILAFDSVSHMNFRRILPLSYAYLTKTLSAVGMSGYTKIGDNTWPNFVSAFSGLKEEELKKHCLKKDLHFDDCPFIWKKFTSQGYLTAYGEDSKGMGNFGKGDRGGFRHSPIDYYYNTLTFEMDAKIGHEIRHNSKWCYGSRLSFEILLDFLKKMAFNMNKVHRHFQLVWATALTHDLLNGGMLGDQMLLDTLTWFHKGGFLDDTVLILMSDHGMRGGNISDTLQGKLENRLPLLYFAFPPWFTEQYQSAVSNLKRNERRLTSHFDLYETLLDLLFLQNITRTNIDRRYSDLLKKRDTPRGISLFLPIPEDRSCSQAGIPEMWCVCQVRTSVTVKNNELVKEAAEQAVKFINKVFVSFPQCAKLTLKTVFSAQIVQGENRNLEDDSTRITSLKDNRLENRRISFFIFFSTSPGDASFEMTATRETTGAWTTSKEFSRTNLYNNQSWCVDDYNLKKLCFCK